MALTTTQVSQLYISLFGRASEGTGNKFWQNGYSNQLDLAKAMLESEGAKTYFGEAFNDDKKFVEHIYKNTLNRDITKDLGGMKFWTDLIKVHGRPYIVNEMIRAITTHPDNAGSADQKLFNNKVAISNYTASKIANVTDANVTPFLEILGKVSADEASVAAAQAFVDTIPGSGASDTSTGWISTPANPGEVFTLTNGTDKATANVFDAPMVYTPDGSDRIKSLQDEDILTGTAGRNDNTLNVEMGQINGDESDGGVRTPHINNIQNVNIQFTGNSPEVDLRYADSIKKVNIDKITKLATDNVSVTNIGQKLDGMRLANAARKETTVKFDFKEGVLAAKDDKGLLELNNVLANKVSQTSNLGTGDKEGYETVDLIAKNGVKLNEVSLNQLKELNIKGSGNLTVANLQNPDESTWGLDQFLELKNGGIVANGTTGLNKLDASGFDGKLTLDVSDVINPYTNPFASGTIVPIDILGGGSDDVFYSKTNPTEKTKLNGNGGNDKLVLVSANILKSALPEIKDIEALELRSQKIVDGSGAGKRTTKQEVDLNAFDEKLASVLVRNEAFGNPQYIDGKGAAVPEDRVNEASTFTLKNISKTLAESGNIKIAHSVDTKINKNDVVNKTSKELKAIDVNLVATLKDSKGAEDSLSITIENANNTQFVFNYGISAEKVENITINDNDTETNIVSLKAFEDHKTSVNLIGGKAEQDYTVLDTILAKTVDASKQLSNLRLNVGEGKDSDSTSKIIAQDIKLGAGNDVLTFKNINDFDASDVVSDKGGDDVVRAAFSKDSTLNISDIEELHIAATSNVVLDIAKADVKKLVLLSDKATDGDQDNASNGATSEAFDLTSNNSGVQTSDIITFTGSKLTQLNFAADLNKDDSKVGIEATTKAWYDDQDKAQNFNGVHLENNAVDKLDINISSELDSVFRGATNYNIGQITAHNSKNVTINVKNEYYTRKDDKAGSVAGTIFAGEKANDYSKTYTDINNVYIDGMETLVVNAKGNLNLHTVSSKTAALNVLKLIDAQNVGNTFAAEVKSLKNDAEVKLGNGDNDFSALGSQGNNIKITAGNGKNIITGSEQNDTIIAGDGGNRIYADSGDNTIVVGSGDDRITTKEGSSNKIDFGKGYDIYVGNTETLDETNGKFDFNGAPTTGVDGVASTTRFTKKLGAAKVTIDVDTSDAIADVDQWVAVSGNSILQVQYTGDKVTKKGVILDGITGTQITAAGNVGGITDTGSINYVNGNMAVAGVVNVAGGKGNDVAILFGNTADALTFKGGDGDDAAVGGQQTDFFEGGAGKDVFVMQSKHSTVDGKSDTVKISDGDSLAGNHDVIYGFDVKNSGNPTISTAGNETGAAGKDILNLDLSFVKISPTTADKAHNGFDVGELKAHSQTDKGLITFYNVDKGSTDSDELSADYIQDANKAWDFVKAAVKSASANISTAANANDARTALNTALTAAETAANASNNFVKAAVTGMKNFVNSDTAITGAATQGEVNTLAQALVIGTSTYFEAITKTSENKTAAVAVFDDGLTAGKYDSANAVVINESNLQDALAYLAKFYDGSGKTVAFRYDRDGNDKFDQNDSIFVFQDGAKDTVVELVGIDANAFLGLENAGSSTDHHISVGA